MEEKKITRFIRSLLEGINVLIWFPLLIASLSAAFQPAPIIILILCAVAFIFWFVKIFSWADSFRRRSPPSTRLYLTFFVLFYFCFTSLFSLVYYAISESGYQVFSEIQKNGDTSFIDCFYFSITTATTLGYGDLSPADSLIKCLALLEVSFGTIFIAAILTVALTFHQPSNEGVSRS